MAYTELEHVTRDGGIALISLSIWKLEVCHSVFPTIHFYAYMYASFVLLYAGKKASVKFMPV